MRNRGVWRRGPKSERDTLARFLWRERDITAWTSAVTATFLFAAAVAFTGRFRWVHRIVFGCALLVSWWQLYGVRGR